MDGKQARRTKSSSALGLMMDHNADAITSFLITIALGTFVKLGKKNI